MTAESRTLKKVAQISLAALGTLLIGAFVLYKQRILFADAAFVVFNIINYKSIAIQANRYGSFITQLFPYLGSKAHLPLQQLLIGYSASFNFFYLIIGASLYRMRQYALTVLMALYYFLIISSSWFWTNNEVHQAVAWMFLLFGSTFYLGTRKAHIVVASAVFILLAFLTVFTHFVAIIPTLFLWVYFIIEKEHWPWDRKNTTILTSLLIAIMLYKYADAATPAESYDTSHLHNVTHFSIKDVIASFGTPVVQMFLYRCLINYWTAALLLSAGLYMLLKENKKILAAWVMLCFTAYLVIMGLTYGDYDEYVLLFHIESEWASIAIIMGIAFTYQLLPKLPPKTAVLLMTLIFGVRIAYIASAFPGFNERINANEEIMRQMKKKGYTKVAILNNDSLLKINKLTWGISYESLMNSAAKKYKPQLVFFFVSKDDTRALDMARTTKQFYSGNNNYNIDVLNPEYFSIDTGSTYRIMTYEELMAPDSAVAK